MGHNVMVNDVYAILPNGERLKLGKVTGISEYLKIRKVIFSGPATIVFWNDGDKTVVKCMKGDQMNYEMGIAMCALKKVFGDSYTYFKNDMKKWVPEEMKQGCDKCWNIKINSVDSERINKGPRKFAEAFAEFLRSWDLEK